jgi:hypothetical protein
MNRSLGLTLNRKMRVAFLILGALLFMEGAALCGEEGGNELLANEKKYVMEWGKERDQLFKNHRRSPLLPPKGNMLEIEIKAGEKNSSNFSFSIIQTVKIFFGRDGSDPRKKGR